MVLILMVFGYTSGCYERRQGALEAENAMLKAQSAQAETVYVAKVDTVRLTRRVTDSVLATITDTVIRVDTVRQLIAAERDACDNALSACDAQKALLTLRIKNLEQQSQERFLGIRLPSRTAMFGLGIVGGYILSR